MCVDIAGTNPDDGARNAFIGNMDVAGIRPAVRGDKILVRDTVAFGDIKDKFAHALMRHHCPVINSRQRAFSKLPELFLIPGGVVRRACIKRKENIRPDHRRSRFCPTRPDFLHYRCTGIERIRQFLSLQFF